MLIFDFPKNNGTCKYKVIDPQIPSVLETVYRHLNEQHVPKKL